jgi:hypothetical protein
VKLRRDVAGAITLAIVCSATVALGQNQAELMKGRWALIKSCVATVNANGPGNFEAVVDDDRVIHYYGAEGDRSRFERCLWERESTAGTLLPKEKWRK